MLTQAWIMKIYEDGASLSSVGHGFRWILNTQQQRDSDGTSIHDRRGYALRVHRTGNDLAWRTVGSPRPTSDQRMLIVEASGTLDFWDRPEEDIYSLDDGEPV